MDTPAFDRFLITLRFDDRRASGGAAARFRFNHGNVVRGLLCRALGVRSLPDGVIPFACESGRVTYAPDEEYCIGVTFVGPERARAQNLEAGLAAIGARAPAADGPPPVLAGNFQVMDVRALPAPDFESELRALARHAGRATLRFLSPLRLERPPGSERPGKRSLDADCFPAEHFLRRLWGRLHFLARGQRASPAERERLCPPVPEGARVAQTGLLWVDVPQSGPRLHDPLRPKGDTTGGVQGRVVFEGLDEAWQRLLVLGRHFHVGENTHYGLGRYHVVEAGADDFQPARSRLERLAGADVLEAAFDHVVANTQAAGIDGVDPPAARGERERVVSDLARELVGGRYTPAPLLGLVLPKADGAPRALAVPTITDRVAQRAAVEILGPAIETLLEDCSYAYRKGFSRQGAAKAIAHAHEQGFRYILDADIESFFDAVDWDRLFAKLEALFPEERLLGLLRSWVEAPVVYAGRTIRRARGLPQGAVISPLLANLYLDEFDEELLGRDYRLVRYADDFVVLCRSLEEASRAKKEAAAALGKLGLRLNESKTGITTFEAGFSYLGYLFCRSMILEDTSRSAKQPSRDMGTVVARTSWLAQVPLQLIRQVGEASPGSRPIEAAATPLASPNAGGHGRRPLYVVGPEAELRLEAGALVVGGEAGREDKIPFPEIAHVVFLGRPRATAPLLLSLAQEQLPVYFCRRDGELYAELVGVAPNWPVWTAQAAMREDADACRAFASAIVRAKLHNAATLAVRLGLTGHGDLSRQLRDLERECQAAADVETIRGYEGRGAALFFQALAASLPTAWGFRLRRRHPPPDPVNAMLSYGYTILYNHLSTALTAEGLNPRLGVFHEPRGAYHALACDLQEEFRHLVDGLVVAMIRKRQVQTEDFEPSADGDYPCLMKPQARRGFITALESRLLTEFTPPGREEAVTYLQFMAAQARVMKEAIAGRAGYKPLRIHG